jgi:two-component system OmpR family sensor kinase
MGRLFWKFFFFIWLAQLTAIVGVSSLVWLKNRAQEDRPLVEIAVSGPATFMVSSAASTLQFGGPAALKSLLESRDPRRPGVYAVDENNREILGRTVAPGLLEQARQFSPGSDDAAREAPPDAPPDGLRDGPRDPSRGVRTVRASDGHTYTLFLPVPPRPEAKGERRAPRGWRYERRFFPLEPMAAGIFVSLIFAALLALYIARPIRVLRGAFNAAAAGDLTARVGPQIGGRRDELADLGRDFDNMATRLQSLIEGQRRLLHDVSHEMRSPLARMQAAIGLARQQPEKMPATLERVERETERMDVLVGELLTLARLEAGVNSSAEGARADARSEKLSLNELVADLVEDARFEAQASGREVKFVSCGEALLQGQPELLHRAIENVVRNAVKHTTAGSSVEVEISVNAQRGIATLTVLDRGPGVPEAELAAIFDPFFRSSATTSSDGHGLGLAIARRVVQTHGGAIRAVNRAGGGLQVEIELPLART